MTALEFALDPIDAAVVAALKAPGNLDVYVGNVTGSDDGTKTIPAPLPYVLFASSMPHSTSSRIGRPVLDVNEFTVTSVHQVSDGAKAVASAVRGLLQGSRITVDGKDRTVWLSDAAESVIVQRDPVWTRPGGLPLFFAMDRFSVI